MLSERQWTINKTKGVNAMDTNKMIKKLLVEAYETESELVDIIKDCLKEMFPENEAYIIHMFEDDLASGKNWNGCLQGISYYKTLIERENKEKKASFADTED